MLIMIIASLISFFAAAILFSAYLLAFVPVSFFIVFLLSIDLAISEHINLSFNLGTKKWGVSFIKFIDVYHFTFGTL